MFVAGTLSRNSASVEASHLVEPAIAPGGSHGLQTKHGQVPQDRSSDHRGLQTAIGRRAAFVPTHPTSYQQTIRIELRGAQSNIMISERLIPEGGYAAAPKVRSAARNAHSQRGNAAFAKRQADDLQIIGALPRRSPQANASAVGVPRQAVRVSHPSREMRTVSASGARSSTEDSSEAHRGRYALVAHDASIEEPIRLALQRKFVALRRPEDLGGLAAAVREEALVRAVSQGVRNGRLRQALADQVANDRLEALTAVENRIALSGKDGSAQAVAHIVAEKAAIQDQQIEKAEAIQTEQREAERAKAQQAITAQRVKEQHTRAESLKAHRASEAKHAELDKHVRSTSAEQRTKEYAVKEAQRIAVFAVTRHYLQRTRTAHHQAKRAFAEALREADMPPAVHDARTFAAEAAAA